MKAQRYTYELVNKEGKRFDKKRMTEGAVLKANDALRNGVNVEGLVWKRNEVKVQPLPAGTFQTPVTEEKKKEIPVLPPEYFKKPARKSKAPKRDKAFSKPILVKDAFGGRLGTRMSKINLEVINAGAKGILVTEIAKNLDEPKGIVGAQLGWLFLHKKGLLTRTEEDDTFRYVATV